MSRSGRSIRSSSSSRGGSGGSGAAAAREFILPLALTATAAIASIGLYLWSDDGDKSSSGGGGSEEAAGSSSSSAAALLMKKRSKRDKKGGGPSSHRLSRSNSGGSSHGRKRAPGGGVWEHDRITEEDTDDLREERRLAQERSKGANSVGTGMSGAVEKGAELVRGAVGEVVVDGTGGGKEAARERVKELVKKEREGMETETVPIPMVPTSATTTTATTPAQQQYRQPLSKNLRVVIVVEERKALQGDDSDSDFEEAGMQRSLLTHLPSPLPLQNINLNILISSPHLRSNLTRPATSRPSTPRINLTNPTAPPSPFPPPKTQRRYSSDSTYDFAISLLPERYSTECIIPYNNPAMLISEIQHIRPEIVYIQSSLCGVSGEVIQQILEGDSKAEEEEQGGCLKKVVIMLGNGGVVGSDDDEDEDEEVFADSDEEEREKKERRRKGMEGKWWGVVVERWGGRVEVVDGVLVGEDWTRRVAGSVAGR